MAERQKSPGRIELTDEVKRLAVTCASEGKTAEEIQNISDELRAQLGAYLRRLAGQTEVNTAQDDGDNEIVEEDPRLIRFADQHRRFSAEDKARMPMAKSSRTSACKQRTLPRSC